MSTGSTQIEDLKAIASALPKRRRTQFVLIGLLMLCGAVAEFVTLGAIIPFIGVMSDPVGFLNSHGSQLGGSLYAAVDKENARFIFTSIFVLALLLAGSIRICVSWLSAKFAMTVAQDLSQIVYYNILEQDYSFHLNNASAELLAAAQKINAFSTSVLVPIMQSLTAVTTAVFIVAALLFINFLVASVSFIAILVLYLVISLIARPIQKRNSVEIARAQSEKLRLIQEGFGGIRDIIINGLRSFYRYRFFQVERDLRRRQIANFVLANSPRYLVETVLMVCVAIGLYFISSQLGDLVAVLPTAAAFALGAQRLMPYMQLVYRGPAMIMGNAGSTSDIRTFVFLKPTVTSKADQQSVTFDKEVRLQDVDFSYGTAEEKVLDRISLEVRKGSFVGIIGSTGSGKSTIIDLMMGLQLPGGGDVLVDGVPLGRHNIRDWQRKIAHVSQTVFLVDGTIADNIALGVSSTDVDTARLRAAIADSELQDLVERLPKGSDTLVGEKGARLSGGERQRIGLARALYLGREILVLDEATSALDEKTQEKVLENVRRSGRLTTVISITHRVGTLKGYDQIFSIEKGRVAKVV